MKVRKGMDKEFPAAFKFSLELEGEKRISASDLFELLEMIMLFGSISRASSNMGLSYRYSWGLIREAEKSLGVTLVKKYVGGHSGGGTSLTNHGQELLKQYRDFRQEVGSGLDRFLSTFPTLKKNICSDENILTETIERPLLLASTIEPVETGLLDLLEQAFFKISGILIRHIALGSGRALQAAKEGRADMVLTHAPELEEVFMQRGWGEKQIPLMANDFVLVGPSSDPAGLSSLGKNIDIIVAFQHIAHTCAPFVSRGDHSGTHLKELKFWKEAGISPKGKWYIKSSSVAGNMGTLRLAIEKHAYTLVDIASFLVSGAKGKISIFVGKNSEAREKLKNIFSLILVSPKRIPNVQYKESSLFAYWIKGKEGQEIISTFGKENFNQPLFSMIS